jgi:CDP-glycerol glycerophosphotransferase (TagB/SpsB family)
MSFFGYIIFLMTSILPKKRWAVLQSFPIFDDNVLEIEFLLRTRSVSRIFILFPGTDVPSNQFKFSVKTKFVRRRSVQGVICYMLSKYVFLTHGLYFWKFPRNQKSVNLWHGMPIKRIGVQNGVKGIRTTYALSTSRCFNRELSNAFGIDANSVNVTNLPRNYRMLRSSKMEKNHAHILFGKAVPFLVWLPTYRRSIIGDIRTDGIDPGNTVNFEGFDIDALNAVMLRIGMKCLIKPHPMAPVAADQSTENVLFIDDNWLYEKGISLYEVLGQSSGLISDVSSVVIDYLLMDKPIFLCFSDFEEYGVSRGFNPDFEWEAFSKNRYDHFIELLNGLSYQFEENALKGNASHNAKFKFHEVCNEIVLHRFLQNNVLEE